MFPLSELLKFECVRMNSPIDWTNVNDLTKYMSEMSEVGRWGDGAPIFGRDVLSVGLEALKKNNQV